ncbi:PrsW family intramembrane metalloprotease [Corynebacterium sp.]|uniref:PrsW family intramembrane metalloprotease n=1 Tax=Corynebacterium sp. TaxID=1720 RepID=UPI0026DB4D7B|nr:PrsW family intramembrane metalloprotease [Corynebacterium sp.]MDO5032583.1 PrsW family intramembrane metalloprotease [Corynebacterium sp.]
MKLFQAALWVIIALGSLPALLNFGVMFLPAPGPAALSLLIAAALGAVGVALWRVSPMWVKGAGWASASVLWGCTAAVSLAFIPGAPLMSTAATVGWDGAIMSWAGAYPEEFSKALGVLFILLSFRQLNRPWHGMVVGAMVGWGFEVYENFLYSVTGALMHPSSDWLGMLQMWGLRLLAGPGLHMCLTALAGYGIGWALFSAYKPLWWRLAVGFGTLAGSFLLHFAWNYMWDATWVMIVQYVLVAAVLYPTVIYAVLRGNRRARADTTYSYLPVSAHLR